ncbi:sulfur carrier protein [Anoxybacillus voinovskiensis]|uniref:Sulfur carrier protein n=1 Tax=Anoxybacteroides voinovskiense TaxID=230470 RepID=A0A840DT35_9BACL|nr:sulfur carrier protein ThiS [Anoxybacillus voinovskiensis]MBB4074833.1 sulfur carrier protein [Anoxybacillus voinovskiensis]GGJ73863.1 sulfur carrier protein ThiS [Anoxybacillus voinovskiensis]
MKLIINGEAIDVPERIRTVADLLEHFQLNKKIAIVEVNACILQKEQYATATLNSGDRVEIVHFVGGG